MARIRPIDPIWANGPWPYRPRPADDELLTSYLVRTAHGLGVKPVALLNAVWGSWQCLLAQDLDNFANPRVVTRIGCGTKLPVSAIASMTLTEYEGKINVAYSPNGRKTWIMPVKVHASQRHRPGLQFCSDCLKTDKSPHFRRVWRLGFATCCTIHGVALRDRCPACRSTVQPHRAMKISSCYHCGADLARAATPCRADHDLVRQQRVYEAALQDGWTMLRGKPVYSPLYFMIVRQLASLFANGKHSAALRSAAVRLFGGGDSEFAKLTLRQPIEYLEVDERVRLMRLVQQTLDNFPDNLIAVFGEANLARSHVVKDMPYVPFVLDEVLRAHLDRKPYYPTDTEVAAAARWLRRTNGLATYRALKSMFGESREALYRHMDYERRQSAPSWRRNAALKYVRRRKCIVDRVAEEFRV